MELTYPDGSTATVEGEFSGCGPWVAEGDGGGKEAAYAEIQILTESGGADSVALEDVDKREAELDVRAPAPGQSDVPQRPEGERTGDNTGTFGTPAGGAGSHRGSSSGCTAGGGPGNAPVGLGLVLALALLALSVRRRRLA